MIVLVLMHQNGWTLHRLICAKELLEESESLEAAHLPPASSLLPAVWVVRWARKMSLFLYYNNIKALPSAVGAGVKGQGQTSKEDSQNTTSIFVLISA